ncbi:MAG: hypothetical protein MK207_02200 [Saprospiraceae bacterium]|nr:hypothetical protein [Saprospiraceae bacterium]
MKRFLLFLAFTVFFKTDVYSQAQKNMVKSYKCSGCKIITLAVDGHLEVIEWDESIFRVVTTIDALNFNQSTLKSLAEAGRYSSYIKEDTNGRVILTMMKAQKELVIRGIRIQEKFKFKVFVPRGVTVEQVRHKTVAAFF